MKQLLALAFTAGALMAALPASANTVGPFSGIWSNTDATQTGRIFRDGNPSVAGTPKPFPGTLNPADTFYYEVFYFESAVGPDAVTVDATVSSANTHLTAFSGWVYDSVFANNAAQYLGDLGASVTGPFSFDILAPSRFMVVASTNFVGDDTGDFSFTVTGRNVSASNGAHVPEPATLALLLASLGAAGVATRRGRKAAASSAA